MVSHHRHICALLVHHFATQTPHSKMELELTPKAAEAVFEGDGGSYYAWSSPPMTKSNYGGGRFVLHPGGLALPHYADISKVGYVIQGSSGVAGMILPNTKKEVVLKLKQGDIIPIPIGSVSWWFNTHDSDSDLIIVFLGDTSKALIPGQFTYFFLNGVGGILGGFSNDLTSKIYNLNQDEVNKLTKSQTGGVIIKVEKGQRMPEPQLDKTNELVYNIDAAKPDLSVTKGGLVTTLTEKEFSFVGEVGLSVIRVKLEANAIKAPSHSVTPVAQLIYIARGSGKVEIVGLNGQLVLDIQVKAGQMLVVPQFFVVAAIAGDDGMETCSIVTTLKPLFEELAGKGSVWGALSAAVQEVSLNVDSEFQKLFISKNEETTNVIPPAI